MANTNERSETMAEKKRRLREILGREAKGHEILAWWVRGLDGRWVPNPLAGHGRRS